MTALATLLALLPIAEATADDRYCFYLNSLSYVDGAVGDVLTVSVQILYGAKVEFERVSNGTTSTYWLSDSPGSPGGGCVDADLVQGVDYQIRLYYVADVTGNKVSIINPDLNQTYRTLLPGTYTADSATLTWVPIAAGQKLLALGAMIEAIRQHDVGVVGETIPASWKEVAAADATFAWNQGPNRLLMHHVSGDPNVGRVKFQIAHEMGHALADYANGDNGMQADWDGSMGSDCSAAYPTTSKSHRLTSKEHQSAAAVEGIAHFYSAIAWNVDTFGSDCVIYNPNDQDWSANGSFESAELLVNIHDCDDAFTVGPISVVGGDFLHDRCLDGPTQHRGTEFDWLRMFWDLRTEQSWGNDDVFVLWDLANPHTWNQTHTGPVGDEVGERMRAASITMGLAASYSQEQADNGTAD